MSEGREEERGGKKKEEEKGGKKREEERGGKKREEEKGGKRRGRGRGEGRRGRERGRGEEEGREDCMKLTSGVFSLEVVEEDRIEVSGQFVDSTDEQSK